MGGHAQIALGRSAGVSTETVESTVKGNYLIPCSWIYQATIMRYPLPFHLHGTYPVQAWRLRLPSARRRAGACLQDPAGICPTGYGYMQTEYTPPSIFNITDS